MAEGFFSRWSQRKEAVRKGEEVAKEPEKVAAPEPPPPPVRAEATVAAEAPPPPPPPTLEDVQSLTKDSDFTRFTRPDVDPEVKNAAMRKLFSDPHFNTMDGLDVYIDDYGKPDPLPPEMLRKLASASFLKLFDEDEKKDRESGDSTAAAGTPDVAPPESVAQSSNRTEQALPPAEDHADPDLRLQQDDAPGPESPGAGSR